jgi:hypothetical protein
MNDQEPVESEEVQVVLVPFVDIETSGWHSSGTNDYKNEYTDIVSIVDRDGTEHEPRWTDEPLELFVGVEAFTRDRRRCVRIHRSALPVRVRFRHYFEYVSYDDSERNSSWTRHFWVRYEPGDASETGTSTTVL